MLNVPDFVLDIVKIEALNIINELTNNQMRVILVDAPDPKHSSHKIRVVDSRPPEWYMELYKIKGRKTFKRHRFVDALKRIADGNGVIARTYDLLATHFLLERIGYNIKYDETEK